MLYTILVKQANGPEPSAERRDDRCQDTDAVRLGRRLEQFLDKQPDPLQGNRQSETIRLRKNGAEIRLAVASIGALVLRAPARAQHVAAVCRAPKHYRYPATAVLDDGSSVEADYVSLGTTVFRGAWQAGGSTSHGSISRPCRFTR